LGLNGGIRSINRAYALAVFRELTKLHGEFAYADRVEIAKVGNSDEVEIKIKCVLDAHGKEMIEEFLNNRNLKMREEKGFVIIYQ
jgi:hypothetical protein